MQIVAVLAIMALAINYAESMSCDPETNNGLCTIAASTSAFANDFLKNAAAEKRGNMITSPLSAQVAMAMTAYGAGGRTATQMRSALRIPADNKLGQSGYRSLIKTLNDEKTVNLSIANKIYTSDRFVIKEEYKKLTETKFLSPCQTVNFGNAEVTAKTINSWCSNQTNHRITDVINPGGLSDDTVMLIVNAVYFKGTWNKPFDKRDTKECCFYPDLGYCKMVPTMSITDSLRTTNLPELDARLLEIPYKDKKVSMMIILPNQIDGLGTIVKNLHEVNLGEALAQARKANVELQLPKFKIETELDLKNILENMGMTYMFNYGFANFSGIADGRVSVSKVVQKAFIEINEEGSEAAAATVVEVASRMGKENVSFLVDRAFYYAIYHQDTNAVLFAGYVLDPTSG